MLDFYPMDGDPDVGFVEVPAEFEQWLIAVSGISFEDVALNVLGDADEDGQVELIMDYDDYMNLCDLYYEYDTLGWMVLDDPEYVEEINAIPDYDAEDEPLFKTQKEIDEHRQWIKESKEKFPDGEVRIVGRDKIDKRSALGKMMSRWDAETFEASGSGLSNKAIAELIESQFWNDWTTSETPVNPGWLNLIISVRDFKLWSRGIKPNRFWKVSDAKKYFNIRGGKESLVTQIEAIQQFITGLQEGDSDATTQFQETVDKYFDAEGGGDKMTFGRMEWQWDTDEEDVDEDAINDMIEDEIRSSSSESGSGTLYMDNEEGVSYEIYYSFDHVFSGYNTAETGYYAAEGEIDDKRGLAGGDYGYYFIEWNHTAEGPNCFICGRLWRPGDYEGHDNICITCADTWQYDEGGPEGEGYYAARLIPTLEQIKSFEAQYAGPSSLFKFGDNESALGGFTAKELTESSAIHGDFDSASLNYSGKQNLEVRQAEDECKCNRGDYFLEPCWECYECGEHGSTDDCWSCGHTTTTHGDWKDEPCWECTDCGEHYTTAQTFDAHARYNINRFSQRDNPRNTISSTRKRIKQQMWKDTTASVGVKGAAAIVAAVLIGVIAWKKK